jgi:formylglycine-generating enzyme required for sulfatase activity
LPAEAAEVDRDDPHSAPFDRLDTDPPVYGLASGVAEWTSSRTEVVPADEHADHKRIIRGGDFNVVSGSFRVTAEGRDPRAKVLQEMSQRHRGLGFRCVRSAKPRLKPEDFIQSLPRQDLATAE